ncbi:Imm26 family immunity protein [Rhizosphaericola mali]|uniref:Immunity protein 26 n=1 Tax=Rhizosphaericola mali TaxID=2545455 RepID=A0A5P2FW47_9BACT|nr:Imm26 family immunity protein [Rhizosphaericola mali]QES87744.1 hypothetical protein E0W69_003365 [Rhizosphaericola mali]
MAIRKEGAFIEILLPNGMFSYGRILAKASFAFYNIYSENKILDLEFIKNAEIIFINSVYKYAISKNRWIIIGIIELEPNLRVLPMEFIQDTFNYNQIELYDPNTGEIKQSQKSECLGLERAAVWEPEHIEDRIIDYFEGRLNVWYESLKIKD